MLANTQDCPNLDECMNTMSRLGVSEFSGEKLSFEDILKQPACECVAECILYSRG